FLRECQSAFPELRSLLRSFLTLILFHRPFIRRILTILPRSTSESPSGLPRCDLTLRPMGPHRALDATSPLPQAHAGRARSARLSFAEANTIFSSLPASPAVKCPATVMVAPVAV